MKKQAPYNQAYVLWLIRQGIASSWKELCAHFELEPIPMFTGQGMLYSSLESLREAQLIQVHGNLDRTGGKIKDDEVTFSVTPALTHVQNALKLSLTDLAKADPSRRLIVNPIPQLTFSTKYKSDILVLMPFASHLTPVYEDHLTAVANELKLKIARADDFFTTGHIMDEIWTAIVEARLLVADCTGRNPNVFYEIGLAHAIGKPTILITQSAEDVPFDLRHRRYLQYELTPRGMKIFEQSLKKTLETVLSEL